MPPPLPPMPTGTKDEVPRSTAPTNIGINLEGAPVPWPLPTSVQNMGAGKAHDNRTVECGMTGQILGNTMYISTDAEVTNLVETIRLSLGSLGVGDSEISSLVGAIEDKTLSLELFRLLEVFTKELTSDEGINAANMFNKIWICATTENKKLHRIWLTEVKKKLK